jgi:NAD(P)-dependent dehydrogenase (short-subunit alcohol dehydrogenase family)
MGGQLAGRVVLVTGGNGGIGLGMAEACARAGADVAIWGTNADKNASAETRLKESGGQVVALTCDVSDEDQVVAAFAETVEGLGKVDACFANAGVTRTVPFVDATLEHWRAITRVNLDGAFLTLREAARHMVARGDGGALVGISSVSTIHGAPANQAYAASKAGVTAMMRGLAVELARHRIRCNAVLPGWIETPMTAPGLDNEKFVANTTYRTPVRRWGQPSDLGPAAVFLADSEHLFHTGDCLVVDGGYSIF